MWFKTMKKQHNHNNITTTCIQPEVWATSIPAYFCSYNTSNYNIKLVLTARPEALTVELLKIQAFWDVTLNHQISISWCFKPSATTHPTTWCHNPEAHFIRRPMGHKATNVQQQQGDSHLKHNSLISTIPWPPILPSTQCCSSLTYLLWPPLGVLDLHSLFLYSDLPPPHLPSSNRLRLFFSQFPI